MRGRGRERRACKEARVLRGPALTAPLLASRSEAGRFPVPRAEAPGAMRVSEPSVQTPAADGGRLDSRGGCGVRSSTAGVKCPRIPAPPRPPSRDAPRPSLSELSWAGASSAHVLRGPAWESLAMSHPPPRGFGENAAELALLDTWSSSGDVVVRGWPHVRPLPCQEALAAGGP